MGGQEKEIVWLVDGENFLARLLEIKLAPLGLIIRRLSPEQLAGRGPLELNPVKSCGVVIVSLPQPGVSSRSLLARIKESFPRHKVINLTPMGQAPPAGFGNASGEHSFPKPLNDPDGFIKLLAGLQERDGLLPGRNVGLETVSP